jgi:hypothetical protein
LGVCDCLGKERTYKALTHTHILSLSLSLFLLSLLSLSLLNL